ncbi:hypothetical protein A2Y83_00605 [Candidatus Falkowbacteria bacterium RBG_13_39_14]|uniref:Polymerase nucleotidyl transferase domain-containing protein n=1 Tax=Candidatus Falkowbacteria bacterium RBG_13_39_14 TaxID=1797985 RepID=A0A1F5S9M1_9BACT|nr:MAG: hypothetical protein A2Y83_00605 [Candidatus Falkowbacteria bacterium RBG_13_39_14]
MQYSPLKSDILSTLSYFHIFQYPLSDLEIWKMLYHENPPSPRNTENSGQLQWSFGVTSPNSQSFGEASKKNPQEKKLLTGQATKQRNNTPHHAVSLMEIKQAVNELKQAGIVKEKNGFYWINQLTDAGDNSNCRLQENPAEIRMERARISENKYKKALRIIKILKCIPFINMIAVCNSLSYKNSRKENDIDLFIITAAGNIWTTRLMAVGLLKLMRLRPTEKNTKNKICASFFISEDGMDLNNIQIHKSKFRQIAGSRDPALPTGRSGPLTRPQKFELLLDAPDIYLLYWIATLFPIYDKKETYAKFIKENRWIKDWLQNWEQQKNHARSIKKNKILTIPFFIISLFIPEFFARKIQMLIMPKHLKNLANIDTSVIINDSMLKFHDKDRRGEYYNAWQKLKNRALHSSPLNER